MRIAGVGTLFLSFAIVLLTAPIAAAKNPTEPEAAPIPSQIFAAKKVFISYLESDADPGAVDLTYNEFYARIKDWGRYELVRAPADADLVFEIRYISGITDTQLRMSIVDPKTHIVLWPFVQHVEGSSREKGRRKNLDSAIEDLVGDLKKVTTPPATP